MENGFEMDGEPDCIRLDWGEQLTIHGGWLRKVILARTGAAGAVEDVFQQVALAAVKNSWSSDRSSEAGPWLHRVAVVCSARYRRSQGRGQRALEKHSTVAGETEPDPFASLVRAESVELTVLALASISPADREVLTLKYSEGWSYREIASRLGITEKAVENRLDRARRRMRRILARSGVTEADL
jgi:RNA polymerase sigma-70 factor (ECF subfamily)